MGARSQERRQWYRPEEWSALLRDPKIYDEDIFGYWGSNVDTHTELVGDVPGQEHGTSSPRSFGRFIERHTADDDQSNTHDNAAPEVHIPKSESATSAGTWVLELTFGQYPEQANPRRQKYPPC